MKTSVEIDENKLKLAKKLAQIQTIKDLVDKALDALIAQSRRQAMNELLGTDFFEGDLNRMRDKHGRTG